jgi:diguanylate cyclase (GGDEF)-like protein/PAS domain S-box-containing protein
MSTSRHAASELERLDREQSALLKIGKLWSRFEGDPKRAVREIIETAAHALDIERVSVWYLRPDRRAILCEDLYDSAAGLHSGGIELAADQYPSYFAALEAEEVIAAVDAVTDPRTREFGDAYLKPHGIGAMLDAPIRAGGKLIGVLCHEHVGSPRVFHIDEINTATHLAGMLGATIELHQRLENDRRHEERLRDEVNVRRMLFSQSRDGIVILDRQGRVHEVNVRFADMLGYTMQEVERLHVWDWDAAHTKDEVLEMIRAIDASGDHFASRHRRRDGTLIDVEISTNGGSYKGQKHVFCIVRDVTERKEIEERLRRSEEQLRHMASQVPGVLYQFRIAPDGTRSFPYFSEGSISVGGVRPEDARRDPSVVFSAVHPEDRGVLEESIMASARSMRPWAQEMRIVHRDGSIRWIGGNAVAKREEDGSILWHGILLDITDRKLAEEKIRYLATTDGLTGLANRTEFMRRLDSEIERTRRYPTTLSLIMFDLDHFKRVNDTFGHGMGDHVLATIARLAGESIRRVDVAGRWGGEEFMVLLPDSNQFAARSAAEKLRQMFERHRFDRIGSVTASFGVTELDPGDDTSSLLKRVDDALYRAKRSGRNRVATIDTEGTTSVPHPRAGHATRLSGGEAPEGAPGAHMKRQD